MKRSKTAALAVGATAAAVQPGGLRKVGAGCLLVLLIGVLVASGGLAALAWWANRPPSGLACPATGPVTVQVAKTWPAAPKAAREAVVGALEDSGRKVRVVETDAAVRVVWVSSAPLAVSRTEAPVVVTVGGRVSAAEVKAALAQKGHLPSCDADPKPAPAEPSVPAGWRWPWQAGATLAASALLALAAWWAIGPEATRLVGRGLRALARALAHVARPSVERVRRAARWIAESGERRVRREEERRDALVAEQIKASAARQAAQEAEERAQAATEAADFERVWDAFERARIEREESEEAK